MGNNPYARYQKIQIETADQGKLLLMLYGGALRFLNSAKTALLEGDMESVNRNLLRAEDIIAELISALNLEAGEVAERLLQLYDYIHHLLVQGNIKKEVQFLEQAETLLLELSETWKEALRDERAAEENRERLTSLAEPGSIL